MALLKIEDAVYRPWHLTPCTTQMQWVINTVKEGGTQYCLHSPSKEQLARWIEERNAEFLAAKKRDDDDHNLRMEIVAELVDQGFAPHVALNLTNTTQKMLEQGRKVGIL